MTLTSMADATEYDELALRRLGRVLGAEQGQRVYDRTLAAIGETRLTSPQVLHAFGQALAQCGGIESAVGAMLAVDASLRSAAVRRRDDTDPA
jgi:hypothetical protein